MVEVQHAPLPDRCTALEQPTDRKEEAVATPRAGSSWAGEFERSCQSPDNTWMRMRTPSPDSTYSGYRGRAPPPPADAMLNYAQYFMQQPYSTSPNLEYITYKPVLCFMTMGGGCQADAETSIGSGSSDWRSDLPSIGSWSSFKGAWSSPPSSDAGFPEMEAADTELLCEVCETPEDQPAEASEEAVPPVTAEDAPSRGSIGHPYSCAAACKYIKKPRGCKDGSDCERCHLCAFRNSKHKKAAKEEAQTGSPAPAALASAGDDSLLEQSSGRTKRAAAKGAPRRKKF